MLATVELVQWSNPNFTSPCSLFFQVASDCNEIEEDIHNAIDGKMMDANQSLTKAGLEKDSVSGDVVS